MRTGSLFSGYSGLDLAVNEAFGSTTAWHSDIDRGACKILAHRYPDVPNLGDITTVDWSQVEPVDVLTGGYPCQPFSHAGRREGVGDDRHLWPHVATAVGILRPDALVFENVRGHLSLGFDEVLRDLSLLHYDATWTTIKAADVGAPHNRARIFIVGRNRGRQLRSRSHRWGGLRRDSRGWRINAGPPEGLDDGQGASRAAGAQGDLRRTTGCRAAPVGEQPRDAHLATEWEEGSGSARQAGAHVAGEVGGGSDRTGVPVDGGLGATLAARTGEVGRSDAAQGRGLSGDGPRGEPSRTRSVGSAWPADAGCPTGRFMVGAGWGPVWSGGVLWTSPDQRNDGGEPDLRHDLTLLPTPRATDGTKGGPNQRGSSGDLMLPSAVAALLPTPACNDMGEGKTPEHWDEWTEKMQAAHGNGNGHGKSLSIEAQRLLPTPEAARAGGTPERHLERKFEADGSRRTSVTNLDVLAAGASTEWGDYAAAIARWETVLGRPAPAPTMTSAKGNPQLSPRFVEWMMGLPVGWVTDVPGITRNEALRALGNGVVPQQCAAALRLMLGQAVAA